MNDEVAGHLIRQIPETHIALEKALQAVALAANRIDYDELKQELQPHKVEKLERALKDVRIRHVTRRSDPMNTSNAAKKLRALAASTQEQGEVPTTDVLSLIPGSGP